MAKGDFFSGFAGFVHDDTAPISQEFERLALEQGWVAKSRPYRAFREECLRTEFEGHFGSNAHDLANWQALCAELGADEIPASKTQAKKILARYHVSIVDLIDHRRSGGVVPLPLHAWAAALSKYIRANPSKMYAKERAKKEGFLKALLRVVFPRGR